mgnify:CR=1 FL=1
MNWKIIKKHIMTGISFMVPVVVGAGLCQALGVILGGPNVRRQFRLHHLQGR